MRCHVQDRGDVFGAEPCRRRNGGDSRRHRCRTRRRLTVWCQYSGGFEDRPHKLFDLGPNPSDGSCSELPKRSCSIRFVAIRLIPRGLTERIHERAPPTDVGGAPETPPGRSPRLALPLRPSTRLRSRRVREKTASTEALTVRTSDGLGIGQMACRQVPSIAKIARQERCRVSVRPVECLWIPCGRWAARWATPRRSIDRASVRPLGDQHFERRTFRSRNRGSAPNRASSPPLAGRSLTFRDWAEASLFLISPLLTLTLPGSR